MPRPNILLIMADELRADALGCYGNTVCRTPHLDALAARGVVFANGMTPNPICVPARAAITTGNYPHRCTGVKGNGGLIKNGQPKIAEHFGRQGYSTYACGKLHYSPYAPPDQPRLVHGFGVWDSAESGRMVAQFDPKGRQRGVEDYADYLEDVGWGGYSRAHGIGNNDVRPCPTPLPEEHHVDHWVADRTIARMKEHAADRTDNPFLIWCSFPKPHEPLDPPHRYVEMYDPRDIPPPLGDETFLQDRNPFMEQLRITHALDSLSPAARQVIKAYYYALISFQDAQIGRVMASLDELGLADDTIVIYTADHGDLMGDFGAYFKCSFLKGSLNVPLLFAGPGVPAGERREHLAGLQDIMPSLATLTGCPLEYGVDGADLTPVLADAEAPLREVFYAQCLGAPRQLAMVTDGQWKYCYAQEGPTEELYNLVADPDELVNLIATADPQELGRWRSLLCSEAARLGDTEVLDPASPTGLAHAPLDRASYKDLPVGGMGWRWF